MTAPRTLGRKLASIFADRRIDDNSIAVEINSDTGGIVTSMLDIVTRDAIYQSLNGGRGVPATFIVITHDKNLINACVTRILSMTNGVIEEL